VQQTLLDINSSVLYLHDHGMCNQAEKPVHKGFLNLLRDVALMLLLPWRFYVLSRNPKPHPSRPIVHSGLLSVILHDEYLYGSPSQYRPTSRSGALSLYRDVQFWSDV
jgi:hypothetical protein